MSTECESVVSPTLGSETLPHPLTLPSNGIRNERHAQSGISYEGRLSLISPLNSYEATMRAAFGIEHPSNHHPTPHLLSPPFTSQVHGFPNPDSLSFPFPEDSRRSIFNIHPPSHSTPGSSRDFVSYGQYQNERVNENDPQIKQESVDPDLQMYRTEPPKSSAETGSQDQDVVFRSSGSRHTSESSPEGATESSGKRPHNLHELTREPSVTSSVLNMETITEKDYMINGDNSSDPGSPFVFQENDDGPCSTESDQHDSREVETDPMSFMNTSFDGSQEGFHGENSKSLKCQFCSYSTDSKIQLGSHLNSHFDHKCMKCEFTTRTIEQLKDHLQEEHELTPEDVQDLESIRVPRVNSQGKVKTFKCKQCGYVAVTKSDFWKHAKTHIKSEKLLSCRKCPFVTEYKHHLEYHMRNHFGSKPYKCNKCSYSCVNKSMLNSHMKSHSNIYQYRCSDCTYATKYCHSLKLHLRKYGHTPAMVLNPDGTPNPVPIIDIYGTRRGPKLKKDENGMPILPPQYQLQAQYVRAHMEVTGTIPPAPIVPPEKLPSNKVGGSGMHLSVPPPPPPFPNPFSFTGNVQNYPSFIPHEFKDSPQHMQKNDTKENTNESSEKEESLNASKSPEVEESLKCEICNFSTQNKDILSHHMLLHVKDKELEKREVPPTILENDGNDSASYDAQKETSPISPPPSFPKEQIKHAQTFPPQLSVAQNTLQEYFARAMNPLLYPPMMSGQSFVHSALEFQQQIQRIVSQTSKEQSYQMKEKSLSLSPIKLSSGQAESVLDLSKEQTPPNVVSSSQQHSSSSTSPSFFLASPPSSDISTPPSKSRRKGRAFKIERIALRLSGSGEEGESSCNEGSETQRDQEGKRTRGNGIPPLLPLDLPESKDDQSADVNGKWGEAHQCQYCDIAFKDVVMYTMHMGYHGYKDPFTCNMCGFDAADKLAFFLHIGRSSHL